MNLDDILKYASWIAFFIVAFLGIYLLMKGIGVL
jgi:putative Mn2+ efflux pump MntP